MPFGPMWERTLDDWRWLLGVNLWGVIHGVREFVPDMVVQRSGHIINTASLAGVATIPNNGLYNASKHAVVFISETLAAEFADQAPGVHASVIFPGAVPSRIGQSERNRPGHTNTPTEPVSKESRGTSAVVAASAPNAIGADVLAQRVLQAVEANQIYIFPNPGSAEAVTPRLDALHRDLEASRQLTG